MFKYSCYIENSKEAREWLKMLGWIQDILYSDSAPFIVAFESRVQGKAIYMGCRIYEDRSLSHTKEGDINCLGNLPLFKALTAVRDDSDYMQQFTDAFNDWYFNENKELSRSFKFGVNVHKATKEELIERFKKEKCYE